MKRIFAALAAVLLAFGIAACGSPDGDKGKYEVNYRIAGEIVHTVETEGALEAWTPDAKTGHTFDGWYTALDCTGDKFTATKVGKDTDLYGKYVPIEYTVTMYADGTVTTVVAAYGTVAVLPDPDPVTGHTFDGWYTVETCDGDKYDEDTPITGDIDLYGTFKPVEYTVTLDIDGKKTMIKADHGTVAELPTPDSKIGHTFDGWYTDKNCTVKYDEQTTVTGNLNLYGKYNANTYTVTLNVDGQKTVVTAKYGTAAAIPQQTVRPGYTFDGWYRKSDFTGEKYMTDTVVTQDVEIYGRYRLMYSASSETADNKATLAADGNDETFWKAAQEGESSLTVDLLSVSDVRTVTQKFAEIAEWDFRIFGSLDKTRWAPFADCTKETADDTYTVTVNGFFRYIKLVVYNADKFASSREFSVGTAEMNNGTNISLGMKANASSWQATCVAEYACDGDYGNIYCANDSNMGHWWSIEWSYMCYVTYIDIYMPSPAGEYTYYIEKRTADGSFVKVVDGTFEHEIDKPYRHEINGEASAFVLHFVQTPGWNALSEVNVYGFKNIANGKTPQETNDGNVYEIGDCYIGAIGVDGLETKAEYSEDGNVWNEITLENGFARTDVYGGYIRTSGAAKIFATPLNSDLALYIAPTTANEGDTSGDPAFAERVCTMNPENTWRQFWCASSAGSERVLTFDLGNECILDSFAYTFQDEITAPDYKLKVEISLDNENYTTKFDNFETGGAGRTFTGNLDGTLTRYVRVTVLFVNNWTNCRQFSLYGVGAPVRYVEVR